MTSPTSIEWYERHATDLIPRYESLSVEQVHDWLIEKLPPAPATVLDVGAGSGRDAAWMADRGYEVVAIEPARAMREEAKRLHPNPKIRWMSDRLPSLDYLSGSALTFDVILLSAVWMHVPPAERPRAFRKLLALLKPGGLLAISLRQGPAESERAIYPAPLSEIEQLTRNHGVLVELVHTGDDHLGRQPVHWIQVVIRSPDDGTGALPLLRHLILNDAKSSTYKLGLLRSLCRAAGSSSGLAQPKDDTTVILPLGLLALIWIRLYLPLLRANLPQTPSNRGFDGLGFVGPEFQQLAEFSLLDLRVGSRFGSETGPIVDQAIERACKTIEEMPGHYLTYPNGGQILSIRRARRRRRVSQIHLDRIYLSSFGEVEIPANLWQAMQRFDVWIEPALITEWVRLMKAYLQRQGRVIEEALFGSSMTWSDPDRDVRLVRQEAEAQISAGEPIYCVWSNRRLELKTLDIDHCFPWSAWPCNDLWNLLPSSRAVNQNDKRDRLPGAERLIKAEGRIMEWWQSAYFKAKKGALGERFLCEAQSSLPGLGVVGPTLESVFDAVCLQRIRLKHDQQIPEWE